MRGMAQQLISLLEDHPIWAQIAFAAWTLACGLGGAFLTGLFKVLASLVDRGPQYLELLNRRNPEPPLPAEFTVREQQAWVQMCAVHDERRSDAFWRQAFMLATSAVRLGHFMNYLIINDLARTLMLEVERNQQAIARELAKAGVEGRSATAILSRARDGARFPMLALVYYARLNEVLIDLPKMFVGSAPENAESVPMRNLRIARGAAAASIAKRYVPAQFYDLKLSGDTIDELEAGDLLAHRRCLEEGDALEPTTILKNLDALLEEG